MALSKISEIRELSDAELKSEIASVKRGLFNLRFQKATRQLEKFHEFKHQRHRLAQLLTVERERLVASSSGDKTTVEGVVEE
ncbi:MAG: 50S ribosomal protein L29 [Leptolyngbyaceae bacterium]|nr:50S ribosomal protein L29 [Leptolyngbyaceae bacterium]